LSGWKNPYGRLRSTKRRVRFRNRSFPSKILSEFVSAKITFVSDGKDRPLSSPPPPTSSTTHAEEWMLVAGGKWNERSGPVVVPWIQRLFAAYGTIVSPFDDIIEFQTGSDFANTVSGSTDAVGIPGIR
jgi:hypothetical protein